MDKNLDDVIKDLADLVSSLERQVSQHDQQIKELSRLVRADLKPNADVNTAGHPISLRERVSLVQESIHQLGKPLTSRDDGINDKALTKEALTAGCNALRMYISNIAEHPDIPRHVPLLLYSPHVISSQVHISIDTEGFPQQIRLQFLQFEHCLFTWSFSQNFRSLVLPLHNHKKFLEAVGFTQRDGYFEFSWSPATSRSSAVPQRAEGANAPECERHDIPSSEDCKVIFDEALRLLDQLSVAGEGTQRSTVPPSSGVGFDDARHVNDICLTFVSSLILC